MALIVQKYGGTSVGTTERILNVARRVLATQNEGNSVVAVVSAMAGVTDNLLKLASEVSSNPPKREMDVLLSTGEQTTIALLAMAINGLGGKAVSLTGAQAGIATDGDHTRARIKNISPDEVHRLLDDGNIVIIAGFQGQSSDGLITTLGRGGSDLSAIAMASAVGAERCQILTDVDGVYTCDPRVVPNARKIDEISYDEMLEMASSGSKVMQSRSVEFAKKFGVIFEVCSSLNTNPGTVVMEEKPHMEAVVIRGVSLERNQAKVTVGNVPDQPGFASRVFRAIADAGIIIDMIVQNTSEAGVTDISFTLNKDELAKAKEVLMESVGKLSEDTRVTSEEGVAKVSAVGIGMRSHSGVAADMFTALAAAKINIKMISTSEIKTAVIVAEADVEAAARAVHDGFGLGEKDLLA
ncbi:MAG: aspartate kinase [Verrucomicrobiales bacterium]|jgi:aspartate kinase